MKDLRVETDEVLVQLYENGNDAAFDVILERYQQVIYNYIYSIVNDETEADDIFQETFFRVISKLRSHAYENQGKFQAWVMRIARNAVYDLFRRTKPTVDFADLKVEGQASQRYSLLEHSIEDNIHDSQNIENLYRMIDNLPELQREVVKMRLIDDLPFKEIARITNTSINTALGRMRYAIINMRKMAPEYEVMM